MIELDDCGKELHLQGNRLVGASAFASSMDVTVQMVIKAPRGTLTLFDQNYIKTNAQCEAIKAFMEGHKDDTTN